MRTSKIAACVGMLTGLLWLAASVESWKDIGLDDGSHLLWSLGLAGFGLASGLVGYACVQHSPLWLRVVVFLCATALGASVMSAINTDMARAYELVGVLGAVALVVGFIGLVVRRSDDSEDDAPAAPSPGGHRAR